MLKIKNSILNIAAIACAVALWFPKTTISEEKSHMQIVEEGKALTLDRKKGNCVSCHWISGAESPGNIGPALVGMKARYPKAELRRRIWDITQSAPEAAMPPFGKHQVLSEDEIDKITEYIYTL